MDDETQARLFALLGEWGDQECVALWEGGAAMYGDAGDVPFAYRGSLAELETLWRSAEPRVRVTPSNVYPIDRSWMLATDIDVSGTRVSGSRELVDAILGDAVLEAVPGVRRAEPTAE